MLYEVITCLSTDSRVTNEARVSVITSYSIHYTKLYDAEILRLWVATQDYRNDTRVGDAILKQVSEAYRRIRNTARYILGNIHDFDPAVHGVADQELLEIDRWALSRLEELVNRVLT